MTFLGSLPVAVGSSSAVLAAAATFFTAIAKPLADLPKLAIKHKGEQHEILRAMKASGLLTDKPLKKLDLYRDLRAHSAMRAAGAHYVTPYISRSIDQELDAKMKEDHLVLIEGDSASGKTRTAFEAVKRYSHTLKYSLRIVIPQDGATLRTAVRAGYSFKNKILWLDDLERFLSPDGLDDGLLRVLASGDLKTVVVATIRAKQRETLSEQFISVGERANLQVPEVQRLLLNFTATYLSKELDQSELFDAYKLRGDPRIAFALDSHNNGYGVIELIAAGPAVLQRWLTGSEGGNRLGAALVSAAVDIYRAGYQAQIPEDWLKAACVGYLTKEDVAADPKANFEDAFLWATEKVHGANSCLIKGDSRSFKAFDYLVDYAQNKATISRSAGGDEEQINFARVSTIPGEVWHTLADNLPVDSPYFLSCSLMASMRGHPIMELIIQKKIEEGIIDKDYYKDGRRLVGLANACIVQKVCVPCAFLKKGLSMDLLFNELHKRLEELYLNGNSESASTTIFLLEFLAFKTNMLEKGTAIRMAAESVPSEFSFRVGQLMESQQRLDAAQIWYSLACELGVIQATERLVAIEQSLND
ncbi:hypothetical protein ACFWY9_38400 [Amycolatopsis sp. NPDC059027]|uniref:hypothetical protein n=1 Tax=Amycolatopsis sp. NPDC059027 TaxID=3346709 RepID=UPI00366B7F0C